MIFGFSKMELVEVIDAHAHAGSKWSGAAIMHVISHMIASGRKRWLSIWCCIEQQCMCPGYGRELGIGILNEMRRANLFEITI